MFKVTDGQGEDLGTFQTQLEAANKISTTFKNRKNVSGDCVITELEMAPIEPKEVLVREVLSVGPDESGHYLIRHVQRPINPENPKTMMNDYVLIYFWEEEKNWSKSGELLLEYDVGNFEMLQQNNLGVFDWSLLFQYFKQYRVSNYFTDMIFTKLLVSPTDKNSGG